MKLNSQQLSDLAIGAAFLGTGGGGNPYVGRLMAQQCLDEGLEIEIIDPSALDDDMLIIPTAMMGAPTVLVEKIPNGEEAIFSLKRLEKHLGRKAQATMPIEIGGINSTIPLVVGARLGLPIVDADGMGRAFPFLEMETFGVYGVSGSPMAVSNEYGDCAVIQAVDNRQMEWLSRAVAIRMGGCAYIAEYAMSGADVKRTAVPNTLSLAIRIGEVLRRARAAHENPIDALLTFLPSTLYRYGRTIFAGKIVDVLRETKNGFSVGRVRIDGFGPFSASMEIEIQNENLIARVNGEVKAIVPDLICIMNTETAEPITSEELRYGQRVTVVAVSVPEIMRTPEALEVFGPTCFGLSKPFVSIEHMG
ncbi:DUF917 domain-containing protein [Rhizobium sp. S152]|uniref:DUF917 domain-containing protein n=1 Tax=Rhizobium sp. S152 TaxID=3055038 RepID=UPI0025A9D9CE|nr:DUF917 domain-containing protein [Rhizobium sp. S152]MDM9625221.1 DUF917 domain-containing protein [Rhizobium sp. S152]